MHVNYIEKKLIKGWTKKPIINKLENIYIYIYI